jgi:hypothetical protein
VCEQAHVNTKKIESTSIFIARETIFLRHWILIGQTLSQALEQAWPFCCSILSTKFMPIW